MIKLNKKGDMFQLIILLVILLITAILGILFYALSDKITMSYVTTGIIPANTTASQANAIISLNIPVVTDETVFFLYLGGMIAVVIGAARTEFSPIMIGLFIVMTFIAILVASGVVEIYQGFAQSNILFQYSSHLVFTNIIFSKYSPLAICLIGLIVLIIMYGKSGSQIQV